MKIYYTVDSILDECKQKCPCKVKTSFNDNLYVRVGSHHCKHECTNCYGRSKEFPSYALFPKYDGTKEFVFRESNYVKCAGMYNKKSWYIKLRCLIYKYVGKYIMDLIDYIDKHEYTK